MIRRLVVLRNQVPQKADPSKRKVPAVNQRWRLLINGRVKRSVSPGVKLKC